MTCNIKGMFDWSGCNQDGEIEENVSLVVKRP